MNFIHNLKYAFKCLLRNKTTLIWTLIFPIGLATLMYVAFGNIFESDELFSTIPIGVVQEKENAGFDLMMDVLTGDEDGLFEIKAETEAEAAELLDKEEIKAIFYVSDEVELVVKEESTEVTILKTVFEEFEKNKKTITDIADKNILAALRTMFESVRGEQKQYYKELSVSRGTWNVYNSYFYAIFAMSCLFASFSGAEKIEHLQANESPLGMRRSLSGTSKATLVFSEFISMVCVQFAIELIVMGYMKLLGIDLGDRYAGMIATLFFGVSIGISLGMIVGSFYKLSSGVRSGICVMVSMVLSVMADLCVGGIKNTIENTMPILNRINPAVLIADSLYALNVYETYDRFFRNMLTLGVMSLLLVTVSFLILRRNKYASL
ncbi:MAG: ABC transporter permease [Clostridiales bacterium]|nr:ABC transporter permease [Candidatus Blautia equi]